MNKLFLLFGAAVVCTAVNGQTPAPKKPNIIFILTDDLGYGDVGVFYQNMRKQHNDRSEPWFSTPNLDKMAAEGAMLTSHYCAAPVCAPSRGSLLSGLSQGQANVRDNQFDKAIADQFTLGSMLKKAGYTTAAIGKWGLQGEGKDPDEWPAYPLKRGFDYFFGYVRHRDGHEHYPKEGIYRAKTQVWENKNNVVAGLDKCYTGDLWTAAAKRWIIKRAADKNGSFFLYLAYDTPHAALELPTQEYPAGGGLNGGMQWLDKPGHMITTASGVPDSWMDPAYANATWDDDKNPATAEVPWPDTYKRYATIVSRIDRQVGDIRQLLTDLGIAENTMVIFTSDNGPSRESYLPKEYVPAEPDFFNSFGPFDGIKRDVLEGGVREPTMVLWPGKIKGATVLESPSVSQDWLPTLANAAGFPAPAFSDGRSFFPLLEKGMEDKSRTVYIEYFENNRTPGYTDFAPSHRNKLRKQMQMFRLGDTVALRYDIKSHGDDFEIYDVHKDPQQVNNLAALSTSAAFQSFVKEEVLKRRMPDSSAKRPYDRELIPGKENLKAPVQGFHYQIFDGNFLWIPSVEGLHPARSGIQRDISTLEKQYNGPGLVYLEGYINAPEDGEYTFFIRNAETFLMKVNEANLFNNEEHFRDQNIYENSIRLKKGFHPFRVYFRSVPGKNLKLPEVRWKIPAAEKPVVFLSWIEGKK